MYRRPSGIRVDSLRLRVQLQHTLIHELDGKPLVLATGIPAADEILLLLNHAAGNRLSRASIRQYAPLQNAPNLNAAIAKLISNREIRQEDDGEFTLTPRGQYRVMHEVIPKHSP
jgi:hypothetical protein